MELDSSELELQVVRSHPKWLLRTGLGTSGRVVLIPLNRLYSPECLHF